LSRYATGSPGKRKVRILEKPNSLIKLKSFQTFQEGHRVYLLPLFLVFGKALSPDNFTMSSHKKTLESRRD